MKPPRIELKIVEIEDDRDHHPYNSEPISLRPRMYDFTPDEEGNSITVGRVVMDGKPVRTSGRDIDLSRMIGDTRTVCFDIKGDPITRKDVRELVKRINEDMK